MVPEAPVGSRVGNIRVVRKLGAGGMGEVYLGFDETLQREVALKAIAGRQRLRGDARARFVREARMLSQLDHPNICRIYDFIEDGESEYLVLELINGRELGEAVASGLEPREKLRIARDVAGVLAAAHEKGIVHRDLKPGNVMLTSENEVKVLDFGLARSEDGNTAADVRLERRSLGEASEATDAGKPDCPTLETRFDPGSRSTEPVGDTTVAAVVGSDEPTLDEKTVGDAVRFRTKRGMVVGTPHFMSPEQARGEPVTTASDMYSFGLLVQSLSTGTSPYPDGLSVEEVLELAKQGETLALAGADVDLARLVGRLKSPALAARPTAATTYERLEWILAKPKRRIRRLAAAALVLVAALAGLKYTVDLGHERNLAVEAREVAERRRGQAEDLIGFMLGDLREKLTPVGRLEILDEVGEQAMEYFAAVPEQELTDRELLSRSRALSQIGDVRMEQGSFPAANKAFEQSLALTRGLVARDPENAEWQVELGASHFWIGYVDLQLGELDEALHHFQTYYEISARLLEQQPDNPKWQLEVAYGHNNLARVLDRQGRPVQALEHYKASVGIRELLFAGDPESAGPKRDLANSQSVLGDALKSARQWPEAVQALEDSLEIRRSLLDADPEHTGWQSDLALSHSKLGKLRLERGEIAQALDHFEENLRLVSVLVSRDSANTRWRRNLAVAEFWLGRVDLARERLEPASSRFDRAEEILLGLLSAEAGELDWQLDLASVRLARGAASLAGGDTSTSEGEAESVVALLEPLPSNGSRVSGVAPRMAEALLLRASAELHESALQEAATSLRRAREIIEPVARDLQQPWLLAVLARVLLLQERVQEARPILSELSRIGYREPEFVRLCRDLGKAAECGHGG